MNNPRKDVLTFVFLLSFSLGVGFQAAPAAASNVEALRGAAKSAGHDGVENTANTELWTN